MGEGRAVMAFLNDLPPPCRLTCHSEKHFGHHYHWDVLPAPTPLLFHSTLWYSAMAQYQNCVFSYLHYWRVNSLRAGTVTYLPLGWPSRYNYGKKGRVMQRLKLPEPGWKGVSKGGRSRKIDFKRQRIKFMGSCMGWNQNLIDFLFQFGSGIWCIEYNLTERRPWLMRIS